MLVVAASLEGNEDSYEGFEHMRFNGWNSTTTRLTVALVLALQVTGCSGGGDGGNASMTPISQCVVDTAGDVAIGGPAARAGCSEVEMVPSSNPGTLGEITIYSGGTLVVGPPSSQRTAGIGGLLTRAAARAAAWVGVADAQTPQSYPRIAEICVEGELEFGTAEEPITSANKIELTFLGDRLFAPISPKCPGFQKGIDVIADVVSE